MKVLALDTSNQTLAVALVENGRLQTEMILTVKKNHSTSLMPTIDFLMQSVGWQPTDLDRIVVAQGPGSYTGLRIGVSTAKTLAYTLGIDLVGISSLQALVPKDIAGLVVPIIDARRNHVYAGFYEKGQSVKVDTYLSFVALLEEVKAHERVTFVGEVEPFIEQITASLPEAHYQATVPSAYQLALDGEVALTSEVMPFEPRYLKRVEAEENWLKDNEETDKESYIKRL
ncbi:MULTISPECIES: tRNA (adenosine(37)-N6)-threonylcarbamoyltransferase complex dimerization subunit type 1 TsaB [unclassified Streptococcus]|uniref:tRNA (adenosine(37)-N6)-threonylcarbamoyltransferase complex dimerization subunit type 1 TsaB n=1 Tax=unclassified Streptococcus TaxID=2608887 RepID=UPI001072279F|nr:MULTISPECIES: tRNA (adenosine(37)-N6)-threonylcarbamoyltransferase complex dimerization subunit type 1 TsaB [unclassified Streptococcus]MBF0788066.1 tRNA (adenosine(37)-N6)-threonylcarbamoyltransferase complex dimerization subunit type 1 TsaB [Streptococcus sp. 19428wC2_LYSM12]MCQ9211386.1 tRNA (adenosine(37)-N6)-threonylcarbamoyltransferase complex dimerization subunit type 1 TsaB [Streptococcus sp. B01]MCQ9214698.1 tRNA (adenosine(37)-N6)-threonylcarbamoyltransferase complex dimerization su